LSIECRLSLGVIALLLLVITGCFGPTEKLQLDAKRYTLIISDSIGVESGDDRYIFGNIGGVCYLENGAIAVADRIFNSVRVYSADGEYLNVINGTGNGPGEFSSPLQIATWNEGFVVSSNMNSKLLFYNSSSRFVKEAHFSNIRPGCPVNIQTVNDSLYIGETFSFVFLKNGEIEAGTEISLWNENVQQSVLRKRTADVFNAMTYQIDARICSCFDSETGILYWADARIDTYTLSCTDIYTDSTWVLLDQHWEAIAKPDSIIAAERELYIRSWNEGTGHYPDFAFEVNPYYRAIEEISIGPDNLLWIRKGVSLEPVFDVFSLEGEFQFECSFQISNWQGTDGWNMSISRNGFLATPRNPEYAPKVYIAFIVAE